MIARTPREDLLRAVDELTAPQQMEREYPRVGPSGKAYVYRERLNGLSLLEELLDAIHPGADNTSRGGFGSKPTIDAAAFDLWSEVRIDVNEWAEQLEINRAEYQGNEGVVQLLRSIPVTAPGKWDDTQMTVIAGCCWRWSRRIRGMLHDHRVWRGIRGAACENCQATWKTVTRFGETYREPVILVQVHPETRMIQYFVCRMCKHMIWPDRGASAA